MAGLAKPGVTGSLFSLQELPSGDPKEEPFREDQCPLEGKSCFPALRLYPVLPAPKQPSASWTDWPPGDVAARAACPLPPP